MVALRQAPVSTSHLQRRRIPADPQDRVRIERTNACHRADSTAATPPPSV
jgi:hypothetical protein